MSDLTEKLTSQIEQMEKKFETVATKLISRAMTGAVDCSQIDDTKRTVPVSFSSETPVYEESLDAMLILDHSPGCCDMSRMEGGPVFLAHDDKNPDNQVAVAEGCAIGSDKVGRAMARFSKGARAQEIFQDVKDGIRRSTSVRAKLNKLVLEKVENGLKTLRAISWTPVEFSFVGLGADHTVGVGRSETETVKTEIEILTPQPKIIMSDPINLETERAGWKATETKRTQGINATVKILCEKHPEASETFRDLGLKAIAEDKTIDAANHELLAAIPQTKRAAIREAHVDLSAKDKERYSIMRAVRKMVNKQVVDGLEGEVSREMEKQTGYSAEGFFVPHNISVDATSADVFRARTRGGLITQRDMNVTTATQGGNFVPTLLATSVIELLRNRLVLENLGVQTLTGLTGNVALPRQTGSATAYSISEQAAITKSTQAIDQIALNPKRVGAWNNYSKQLIQQSSIDAENFMRDDLMRVLAIKIDKLGLEGSGAANEPTGVKNSNGIGSVTFGAAATFAKLVAFETALATANADLGSMGYVTTPAVRGTLKSAAKLLTGATTVAATALWDNDQINGYAAKASNQIANNCVAFGNWNDLIMAYFGGLDVVVDPYSVAETATVRIVLNQWLDVAVRHAASFAWSTDSGAQ